MNVVAFDVAENKVKEYIYSLDLSSIAKKLVKQYNWRHEHVIAVIKMYKNFLFLNVKYGKKYNLTPSEEIDEIWHLHILDTKNYRRDCEMIFGKYFDHNPMSFDGDVKANFAEMSQSFNKMVELYRKEFANDELYQIRGFFAKLMSFFKGIFKNKLS